MLEKLEMHDIQDKTRLLDEMNETRDGVNEINKTLKRLEARWNKHISELPFLKAAPAPKEMPQKKKAVFKKTA